MVRVFHIWYLEFHTSYQIDSEPTTYGLYQLDFSAAMVKSPVLVAVTPPQEHASGAPFEARKDCLASEQASQGCEGKMKAP